MPRLLLTFRSSQPARLLVALAAPAVLLMGCAWSRPPATEGRASVSSPHIVEAGKRLDAIEAREAMDDATPTAEYQRLATSLVSAVQSATQTPLIAGNSARLLIDGPRTYQAIFDAVGKARHHVHVETYIFDDDRTGGRFAHLLVRKRREGVAVRVIYDAIGSIASEGSFFEALAAQGIEVAQFRPLDPVRIWKVNNRDHRKLIVVDGRVAFTGGINISDTYSSGSSVGPGREQGREEGWRDTQVEIRGPAVRPLQDIFLQTWRRLGRDVPAAGDLYPILAPVGDNLVQAVTSDGGDDSEFRLYDKYLAAIRNAQRRIWITQAYFAPTGELREALVAAVGRGVDVRVIVPGFTDSTLIFHASRATYEELLSGGVRLFEFTEALLHSKTAVIDGVWSTVGSCNIDPRSFAHNNELNAAIVGRDFARTMEAMFRNDLERSSEILARAWSERPVSQRLKERLSSLVSYWL